ncbi:MAG: type II toxin-antitoxin system death-on-curing family toxin [Demequina sp.]
MTVALTLEDLIFLVEDLRLGPVRDIGLLDSAVHRPFTTLMGADAYPSIEAKAAAMMHSLVCNHALVDGNKRLGWHATVVFLALNDRDVTLSLDEAFHLTMDAASGDVRDVDLIAARLTTRPRSGD